MANDVTAEKKMKAGGGGGIDIFTCMTNLLMIIALSVISAVFIIVGILLLILASHTDLKLHHGTRSGIVLIVVGAMLGGFTLLSNNLRRKKKQAETEESQENQPESLQLQVTDGGGVGQATSGGYRAGMGIINEENGSVPYGYASPAVAETKYMTATNENHKF